MKVSKPDPGCRICLGGGMIQLVVHEDGHWVSKEVYMCECMCECMFRKGTMRVVRKDGFRGQALRAYEIGTVNQKLPDWLEVDIRQLDIIRRLLDLGRGCVVVEGETLQLLTRAEFQEHYTIVDDNCG